MESDLPVAPQFQFLASTLLEIAQERSLEQLLQKVVRRALEMPSSAIAVIWLMDSAQGDVTSVSRPASPDPTRCLYAVAGGVNTLSEPTQQPTRLPDHLARIGLGVGPIGRIATTRQPLMINDLDMDPGELASAGDWLKAEHIHAFIGAPIIYKDEVLGVLGAFGHSNVPSDASWWGRVFADHIAGAIANARAFEEIGMASQRLKQANQQLGRELAERKEAEAKLKQSEQRYRRIVDTASEGIWELDERYATTYVNQRMAEMLGYEPREMVGSDFSTFLFDDDLAALPARIAGRRQGLTERYEQRYRHRDGSAVWMHVSATSVQDAEHGFKGSFAMLTDITERKRAEESLRRKEAYLAEGQRLAHTGSWAWNPATYQALYWSEEMFRIYGLDSHEGAPTAETFWRRVHPEDRDRMREGLHKAVAERLDYEHDLRIVLPDGTIKHIHAVGHPVLDEAGNLVEYIGTAMDVTDRKRAEDALRKHREHLEDLVKQRTEQLAEAKARAEAANHAKSTFLANMSHELRTPLNAVLGFSRLLKTGSDVTPQQQETLDIIVRSGEHLLNLVNNVLDMAKIEAGKVVLDESEADLHRLLHEIQSLMGVGAAEKALPFTLECAPDLPRFVTVDAGKLRQVLLNLVGNAIKYTDSGEVKLHARPIRREGTEEVQVRFEVEDSGPGISPEDCQRIFSPFVQGSQTSAQAGTGLGLAICKQYVELMGGRIDIASRPGKGSVFHFSIPVSVLPSVAEPDEPMYGRIVGLAEGQPRYRLLIVEDQPENRLLLRRLLEPFGFELRDVGNGQEAVTLFEQWRPDLVWMDIRMPVMDGLEAVRRIRAIKAGADTRIIALTAHALEDERTTIMAAGFDDLVRKPFREHEIFDALARHLRLKFVHEQAPGQESPPETSGLVVYPEQLDALPAKLLQDLRQAVLELDTARTQALIEQVTEREASLGRALNTLATQLDYSRLLKLLEREDTHTGKTL